MLFWISLVVVLRYFLGAELAIEIYLYVIGMITVVSGFSYLADAWSALKGTTGSIKEVLRFILDGLAVPMLFIFLFVRDQTTVMAIAIILVITQELLVGGLGNLLASKQQTPNFRLMTLKSLTLVLLASVALLDPMPGARGIGFSAAEISIFCALAVTSAYTILSFWKHRQFYLNPI